MRNATTLTLLLLLAAALAVGSGCDTEPGALISNLEPNTRISAGPPEATDTGFNVELFWFGWDDDGTIDYYEISWETPDSWEGPIFTSDSLFTVEASETCCVDPLPDHGGDYLDTIHEQYHTFYVRSVDEEGLRDPTPAVRSFNAKTIAPYTDINFGPGYQSYWGTRVEFRWAGLDDDGIVVAAEYALTSLDDYLADPGTPFQDPRDVDPADVLAWVDTLTYRPLPGGTYSTEEVWIYTEEDSVVFPSLPVVTVEHPYYFMVKSIDDAGAIEQRHAEFRTNFRQFWTTSLLGGPTVTLASNIAGLWVSGSLPQVREVFAGQGLRFTWSAVPGESATEVAGFSYAVDDTADWSAFTPNDEEWPEQSSEEDDPEVLWFPSAGTHSFFLRAVDQAGFIATVIADLEVFPGPRFCPIENQTILIVLDGSPSAMIENGIWPSSYPAVERGLVDYWFEGYDFQVHDTEGSEPPDVSRMDCATTMFWLHRADLDNSDPSVLNAIHEQPPNILPSYVESGGNLILAGLSPTKAMAYFEPAEGGPTLYQDTFPVNFQDTIGNPAYLPHWVYETLGIQIVLNSFANTSAGTQADLRISKCTSLVTDGDNPYPDLHFDPLSWPQGPEQGGFGFYDSGMLPTSQSGGEAIYVRNDTNESLGVRVLEEPGINGNLVFLGFHPYFIQRPQFRELVRAILTDFGEERTGP